MVTGRGIIFICSTDLQSLVYPNFYILSLLDLHHPILSDLCFVRQTMHYIFGKTRNMAYFQIVFPHSFYETFITLSILISKTSNLTLQRIEIVEGVSILAKDKTKPYHSSSDGILPKATEKPVYQQKQENIKHKTTRIDEIILFNIILLYIHDLGGILQTLVFHKEKI